MLMDGRSQAQGLHERGTDATLLLVFNSHHEPADFALPTATARAPGHCSSIPRSSNARQRANCRVGERYHVGDRSLLLFELLTDIHVNDATLRSGARSHSMPFGAELRDDGTVRFSLWAPAQKEVGLRLAGRDRDLLLEREKFGWHSLITDAASAGSLYQFVLPDGLAVPDPASRFQPQDVHGPSEVVDPRQYRWHDAGWHGRPWHEAVIYELHVGCFTAAGTYRWRARTPARSGESRRHGHRAHAVGGLPGTAQLGL